MAKKSNAELRKARFAHRLLVAQAKGVIMPDPSVQSARFYATDGTYLKG